MSDSQQRLRDELHRHTSLIHSLRCVDQVTSIRILEHLRGGAYDGTLLGRDAPQRSADGERIYLWDSMVDELRDRPRWNSRGMSMPYASTGAAPAWPIDGAVRTGWMNDSSMMAHSHMDGVDGVDRVTPSPVPYGQRDLRTESSETRFRTTSHPALPQNHPPFQEQQHYAPRYEHPQPPSSLTLPLMGSAMPSYGQRIPQWDPERYSSEDPSRITLPSVEDRMQHGRR